MPINLASPGIVVKEVDLTIGRVDTASANVGALVAPFAKGPVNTPILVENEQDLLDNFGEPAETDKHYDNCDCSPKHELCETIICFFKIIIAHKLTLASFEFWIFLINNI